MGFGGLVDLEGHDFIGKAALAQIAAVGAKRQFIGVRAMSESGVRAV